MSRLLGYISLGLVLFLCMSHLFKKYDKQMYVKSMKVHKLVVILILICSLIHGILAGKVNGMVSGKVSWIILLLSLIIISLIRKYSLKMKIHHILLILFLILVISHIVILW